MLIVSKWHDYYDTASAYGVDKTCVYKRTSEFVPVKREHWADPQYVVLPDKTKFVFTYVPGTEEFNFVGVRYAFRKKIIGFCGKLYPMVLVEKYVSNRPSTEHAFYSKEEVSEFMELEGLETKSKSYWPKYSGNFKVSSQQGLSNHFDVGKFNNLHDLFHIFRTPVFVLADGMDKNGSFTPYLVTNPELKKLRFMSVKDPQTAFQGIYMYISGVLGIPPKETRPISNEIMAASKGHDSPYSFRKPPGKRGKTRWR